MKNPNITVIAVGGSLIVPHLADSGGVDVPFLRAFHKMLLGEIKKPALRGGGGRTFVLVAGGGKTARMYRDAARQIGKTPDDDLDWIGIAATKLNAQLLRAMFKETQKHVLVEGGVKPGQSTDYVVIELAKKYKAKSVIIAGDTNYVYDSDPKKNAHAKPIEKISWRAYRKLIPAKWSPGLSSPVDPIAAKLAQKTGISVKILKGTDLQNLKNAVEGKKFQGTIIE